VSTRLEAEVRAGAPRRARTVEAVLVPLGALALAAVMTWPALRHPASTIPHDVYDPLLIAWTIAWGGHAIAAGRDVWDTNTFYPEPDSLAFSDSFLGYAPLAVVGDGPAAALVRYNLVYVGIAALAFVGAYALARQLGARWSGALVAGAAFAYAPWRLAQAGHLHILSTGGIALALALLCRGHGYSLRRGFRPEEARPGWAAAGWAVAAWQLTIGFGVGLPFAYVLAVVCAVAAAAWLRTGRRPLPRGLLLVDAGGAVVFAAVGLALALPYLRVIERYPSERRTVGTLELYSPRLSGFLTAPAESRPWGEAHAAARAGMEAPAEMTLLPGLVVLVLAVAGVALSVWSVRQRTVLAGLTVLSVVLAMGTQFPGGGRFTYLVLFHHLPGLAGLRTPGRLVVWTTLGLGLLAAGAVSAAHERLRVPAGRGMPAGGGWPGTGRVPARGGGPGGGPGGRGLPIWAVAALLLPALLVVAEGTDRTPHPEVPRPPAAMARLAGPAFVLPTGQLYDQRVMLWSTDGFPEVVNGGSGITPDKTFEARERAKTFPDAQSVDHLRRLGVRTVLVVRADAAGTDYAAAADAPVVGLPLSRSDEGDVVVFTLDPLGR